MTQKLISTGPGTSRRAERKEATGTGGLDRTFCISSMVQQSTYKFSIYRCTSLQGIRAIVWVWLSSKSNRCSFVDVERQNTCATVRCVAPHCTATRSKNRLPLLDVVYVASQWAWSLNLIMFSSLMRTIWVKEQNVKKIKKTERIEMMGWRLD